MCFDYSQTSDVTNQNQIPEKYQKQITINKVKKEAHIRSKYGFQTSSLGEHGLFAVGQMNMVLVAEIANDSDIEKISGVATPASY